MRQIILKLAEMGKTIIVTSHILPELSRICNVVAIVTGGKLRAFGTLDDIMRDVRQYRMMELQLLNETGMAKATEIITKALEPNAKVNAFPAEGMVRFSTAQTEEKMAALLKELMLAGLPIVQFREEPQDLEDAFLSVTQTGSLSGGHSNASPARGPLVASAKGSASRD